MLHMLLMILKILGIVLLVVLGIILAVVLLVLLVPVRYQGDVSFDGKPEGGVLVSWLLRLVTVRVNYDGSVKALVKVLWFKVFSQTVWAPDSGDEDGDGVNAGGANGDGDTVAGGAEGEEEPVVVQAMEVSSGDAPRLETKVSGVESASSKGERAGTAKAPDTGTGDGENAGAKQQPLIEKLIEKICAVFKAFAEKISGTYTKVNDKFQDAQGKIEKARVFLEDPENQGTIRLLWNQVKKLIRHILPGKIRGRVRFGFDDPSTTGQILTYISPFYGLYAESVAIEPVFDEKVMEGELHIKGRIRLGSLIWIVVRIFFNKNFRKLLRSWRRKGM